MTARSGPRRPTTGLLVLIAALSASGCQSFEQRFVAIESRQAAIEAQIADLQAQQQTLIARLVQVRQELDNALQPLRTQSADRGEDVRSMQRQVTALEDTIAQMGDRISRLTEQVAAGGGASGQAPLGTPMPPARGVRAPAPRQGTPPEAAGPQDSEATSLYNSAFNDYLRESYDLCIQGFQEYIRRYSTSERADDAQYWIGECHSSKGERRQAREAFQELVRRYPASDKVPDAMLRDALLLKEEGQNEAAEEALRRVIQAYSTSDAAFLACRELDKMGAAKPAACEQMR